MKNYSLVLVILTGIACFVSGCKLNVIVPVGGDVELVNGVVCVEGTVCEYEIDRSSYMNNLLAIPKPGYEFVRWQAGNGFIFCADTTEATCSIALAPDPITEFALAVGGTTYLMPVFKDVGDPCPPDDVICGTGMPITGNNLLPVIVDGREWAQVDLFSNLSWNDLNTACPGGYCRDGRVLNGWDMTGWSWASTVDFRSLLNNYVVRPPLSIATPTNFQEDALSIAAFFNDGWRPLSEVEGTFISVDGWTSDQSMIPGFHELWYVNQFEGAGNLDSIASALLSPDTFGTFYGAWIYRSALTQ